MYQHRCVCSVDIVYFILTLQKRRDSSVLIFDLLSSFHSHQFPDDDLEEKLPVKMNKVPRRKNLKEGKKKGSQMYHHFDFPPSFSSSLSAPFFLVHKVPHLLVGATWLCLMLFE